MSYDDRIRIALYDKDAKVKHFDKMSVLEKILI